MDSGYLLKVEHDEFAKRVKEEHERTNARLKEIEERQRENNKMLVNIERIAIGVESNEKELKKINVRLDKQEEKFEALESRDGEKWRSAVSTVFKIVAGAIVGLILAQIGLG